MNPGAPRTRSVSNTDIENSFGSFLADWLVRQEHYLDELHSASLSSDGDAYRQEDLEDLISRVLSHYQQYYDEKSRVVQQDVFLLFSQPWLTRLERALLWLSGFNPASAVQLASTSVDNLTRGQVHEIQRLLASTRMQEKMLNDEMARIQEGVGGPPLLGAARRSGQLPRGGAVDGAEAAVVSLKASMEAVVANADTLRSRTALRVIEILRPAQGVKFLAAAARHQLRIRSCGLQRDMSEEDVNDWRRPLSMEKANKKS